MIIKYFIELNITEIYVYVVLRLLLLAELYLTEIAVVFQVCWAFEFLLIMGLWADFVSNSFWICVLALSRGTPLQAMTCCQKSADDLLSVFHAPTGMWQSRHWSKKSCYG